MSETEQARRAHRAGALDPLPGPGTVTLDTPEFPPRYEEFRAARERYLASIRAQTDEFLVERAIRGVLVQASPRDERGPGPA